SSVAGAFGKGRIDGTSLRVLSSIVTMSSFGIRASLPCRSFIVRPGATDRLEALDVLARPACAWCQHQRFAVRAQRHLTLACAFQNRPERVLRLAGLRSEIRGPVRIPERQRNHVPVAPEPRAAIPRRRVLRIETKRVRVVIERQVPDAE